MSTALDIRLKKANKVYHEGENVTGVVLIQSASDVKHDGITLTMEGTVNLQLSAKNVGIFEAFCNSVKSCVKETLHVVFGSSELVSVPHILFVYAEGERIDFSIYGALWNNCPIQLLSFPLDIAQAGKIPAGKTEIPFEFPLKPRSGRTLYETYHGVFVNVQYLLRVEMKRSFLSKDLIKVAEFIVEYKEGASGVTKALPRPVTFTISPESLQNVRDKARVPRFRVTGRLDSTACCITKPFSGELIVEHCEVPIKSVELQLVRVETCGCAEGYSRDATEVQNIQIGEGNVPCKLAIPIYMVFPRLFTCPSLSTNNFKVEFEINIVIVFQDDHLITENFPIALSRF